MLKVKLIVIVIALILILYFIRKRKYFFKSLYETAKVNPIVRNRIFKYILKVISRLFFKR